MTEESPQIESRIDEEPSSLGDWLVWLVFQAIGYSFMIALLGLIGGMFGGMFGGAFGQNASRWGWIAGALLAAVGYPLGWIRVGNGRLHKRSRAEHEEEERRPGKQMGPLKGGFAGLFIGAILGIVVGMVVIVYWLSIALSPFAPASWREGMPPDLFAFPGPAKHALTVLGWTIGGFAVVFLFLGMFGQIYDMERPDKDQVE